VTISAAEHDPGRKREGFVALPFLGSDAAIRIAFPGPSEAVTARAVAKRILTRISHFARRRPYNYQGLFNRRIFLLHDRDGDGRTDAGDITPLG
jgi:hypothetical protein